MSRPVFWPVSDDPFAMRSIAFFFEYDDAVDFVNANLGTVNLYIGEPRYDRRAAGYRPAEKPSGYREWLMEIELRKDGGRIAA